VRAQIAHEEAQLAEVQQQIEKTRARIEALRSELAALSSGPRTAATLRIANASPAPTTSAEKVTLFRKLFRGREDIFPTRFVSRKTGRPRYAPACANKFVRGVCALPQVKCGECPNQAFISVRGRECSGSWMAARKKADRNSFLSSGTGSNPDFSQLTLVAHADRLRCRAPCPVQSPLASPWQTRPTSHRFYGPMSTLGGDQSPGNPAIPCPGGKRRGQLTLGPAASHTVDISPLPSSIPEDLGRGPQPVASTSCSFLAFSGGSVVRSTFPP
jgi:hypothetical protein